MFGGVELGDEPVPAPEQLPFVFVELWYIIESPLEEKEIRNIKTCFLLIAPTVAN